MTAWNQTPDRPASSREDRKLRKPLIERKRRERINVCLEQLRETVVGVFNLDQSKLEKADILEMTVKHLQNIQSSKANEAVLDAESQQRFSTGYIQCMHEVHNLLLSCDWMDKTLGARLLSHLLRSLPRSAPGPPESPQPKALVSSCTGDPERFLAPESCPSSPAGVALPTCSNSPAPLSGLSSTESPQLTALEMWRPW